MYIPELNYVIEFDGIKFHHPSYSENYDPRHDKAKTTYIKRYHPELTFIRLNEFDYYSKRYIKNLFNEHIKFKKVDQIEIRKVTKDNRAKRFLELFDAPVSSNISLRGHKLGFFRPNEKKLLGIAILRDADTLIKFTLHPSYESYYGMFSKELDAYCQKTFGCKPKWNLQQDQNTYIKLEHGKEIPEKIHNRLECLRIKSNVHNQGHIQRM